MALAGLTCEIYFKSLLFLEDDIRPDDRKEHNLCILFDRLNDGVKQGIINKMNEKNERTYCFDEELSRHKYLFNDFRYSYELNGYHVNTVFMTDLVDTLHDVADSMEW